MVHAAGVNEKMILNRPGTCGEGNNPYQCKANNNQLESAKYGQNNLASVKHSVCSWTPYGYRKESA